LTSCDNAFQIINEGFQVLFGNKRLSDEQATVKGHGQRFARVKKIPRAVAEMK
jgi:hypothetical protein